MDIFFFMLGVLIGIIILMWLRVVHWKHLYFDEYWKNDYAGIPHPLDNSEEARLHRIHTYEDRLQGKNTKRKK